MSPVRQILNIKPEPGRRWWEIHPTKGELIVSFWMFMVSGVALVGILGYRHNTNQIVQLSHRNERLALRANTLGKKIQAQRYQSLLDDCSTQNIKNRHTISKLNRIRKSDLKTVPMQVLQLFRAAGVAITNPAPLLAIERSSINGSYISTAALLAVVLPYHKDCHAYAIGKVTGSGMSWRYRYHHLPGDTGVQYHLVRYRYR